MPFMETEDTAGKKRKRLATGAKGKEGASDQKRIKTLEAGIIESRTNYNDIVELQQHAENVSDHALRLAATLSLCRVFAVLLASGSLAKGKHTSDSEAVLVDWLKAQYANYCELLLAMAQSSEESLQETAIHLILKLVKGEAASFKTEQVWRTGLFTRLIRSLVASAPSSDSARQLFIREYLNAYDDIRYYTFRALSSPAGDDVTTTSLVSSESDAGSSGRIALLLGTDAPSEKKKLSFFGPEPESQKHALHSMAKHKKQAQEAWLDILKAETTESQQKEILSALTRRIAPWFTQIDLLADFLTDSYNAGGALSLLALSGIFHLIAERNLDYPSFYVKLYSLLDEGLLHSKHRSRFFRHLEVFMSSSHLPAALVASFIKRLARLSLYAPPAGIIVVCPWIYNMLKAHPQCTFMIHRETHDADSKKKLEDQGIDDPFDAHEVDPLMTGAIDSSLWEIETLQSHYHPNVASLAKIISEQFTKQAYKMEDFLDYSYASIIEVDLGKDLKKTPVTEWQIPKHIFSAEEDGLNTLGALLEQVREHTAV